MKVDITEHLFYRYTKAEEKADSYVRSIKYGLGYNPTAKASYIKGYIDASKEAQEKILSLLKKNGINIQLVAKDEDERHC